MTHSTSIKLGCGGIGFAIAGLVILFLMLSLQACGSDSASSNYPDNQAIEQACQYRQGIKNFASENASSGYTDAWMVLCNDGTVHRVQSSD